MEYLQLFQTKEKKEAQGKWQPPMSGMIKVNLDGAYTHGDSFVSRGVEIRDEVGDVMLSRAGKRDQVTDPFGAEVIAMNEAIATAADVGALCVVFETDSKLLQEALDFTRADSSPYAAVIEDCKFQLELWFSKQSVALCRRSANYVAHELAKLGRLLFA